MKLSKFFSSVFAVLGAGVMILSILLCLLCRNHSPKSQIVPQEAEEASRQFMQALSDGDYRTAGGLLYGQPELGAEGDFQSDAAAYLWEAFRGNVSWEAPSGCYLEGAQVYRDVTVTVLDVTAVLDAVPALAQSREDSPSSPNTDALLLEAVKEALSGGKTQSVSGKLRLIQDGDQWYVIPDKQILSAISGGRQ